MRMPYCLVSKFEKRLMAVLVSKFSPGRFLDSPFDLENSQNYHLEKDKKYVMRESANIFIETNSYACER